MYLQITRFPEQFGIRRPQLELQNNNASSVAPVVYIQPTYLK